MKQPQEEFIIPDKWAVGKKEGYPSIT